MSHREFISFRFNYCPSVIEGMSDVLVFENDQTKELERYTLSMREGWFKTVTRLPIPKSADYLYGYNFQKEQGIQIHLKGETITYLKKAVKPENDFY